MVNNLREYIKTFEFLSPNPIVVLDKNYNRVYHSHVCDKSILKLFVKELKNSKSDNFTIKLDNGNVFKSSSVLIVKEQFYLVSIERIDSNPYNFDDPLLRKISFFLDSVPDGVAILKNDEVIFRNDVILELIGMPKNMKDSIHYSKYIRDESLNELRNIIKKNNEGDLILKLKTES